MARTTNKSTIQQIANAAKHDQAIVTITNGNKKLLLPIEGNISTAGGFTYVSLPTIEGIYVADSTGNLSKASTSQMNDVEAAFFPERAEELSKLQELAKKHGFSLVRPDSNDAPTTKKPRAPRGSRVVAPKRDTPKVGDKFTSTVNGIVYTITKFEGKTITFKGEDGTTKDTTYSGIFWRWWNKA